MRGPFDIFCPRGTNHRGEGFLKSMKLGAKRLGLDAQSIQEYVPRGGATLVIYGMGGPLVYAHAKFHMKHGTVLAWDVGYWGRYDPMMERKYRLSINGLHCPKLIMKGPDPGNCRLNAGNLSFKPAGDPNGPILLVGNGPKSNAIGASGWTLKKSVEIRQKFPGKQIIYRPKPKRPMEQGVFFDKLSEGGTIDEVLAYTSLVVCRHSNVAVDACRLGVPVVCEDGAAAAIYPHSLDEYENQPSAETRAEFLRRLAWWQWSRKEAEDGSLWEWLLKLDVK